MVRAPLAAVYKIATLSRSLSLYLSTIFITFLRIHLFLHDHHGILSIFDLAAFFQVWFSSSISFTFNHVLPSPPPWSVRYTYTNHPPPSEDDLTFSSLRPRAPIFSNSHHVHYGPPTFLHLATIDFKSTIAITKSTTLMT
jgi:hypothetical protein